MAGESNQEGLLDDPNPSVMEEIKTVKTEIGNCAKISSAGTQDGTQQACHEPPNPLDPVHIEHKNSSFQLTVESVPTNDSQLFDKGGVLLHETLGECISTKDTSHVERQVDRTPITLQNVESCSGNISITEKDPNEVSDAGTLSSLSLDFHGISAIVDEKATVESHTESSVPPQDLPDKAGSSDSGCTGNTYECSSNVSVMAVATSGIGDSTGITSKEHGAQKDVDNMIDSEDNLSMKGCYLKSYHRGILNANCENECYGDNNSSCVTESTVADHAEHSAESINDNLPGGEPNLPSDVLEDNSCLSPDNGNPVCPHLNSRRMLDSLASNTPEISEPNDNLDAEENCETIQENSSLVSSCVSHLDNVSSVPSKPIGAIYDQESVPHSDQRVESELSLESDLTKECSSLGSNTDNVVHEDTLASSNAGTIEPDQQKHSKPDNDESKNRNVSAVYLDDMFVTDCISTKACLPEHSSVSNTQSGILHEDHVADNSCNGVDVANEEHSVLTCNSSLDTGLICSPNNSLNNEDSTVALQITENATEDNNNVIACNVGQINTMDVEEVSGAENRTVYESYLSSEEVSGKGFLDSDSAEHLAHSNSNVKNVMPDTDEKTDVNHENCGSINLDDLNLISQSMPDGDITLPTDIAISGITQCDGQNVNLTSEKVATNTENNETLSSTHMKGSQDTENKETTGDEDTQNHAAGGQCVDTFSSPTCNPRDVGGSLNLQSEENNNEVTFPPDHTETSMTIDISDLNQEDRTVAVSQIHYSEKDPSEQTFNEPTVSELNYQDSISGEEFPKHHQVEPSNSQPVSVISTIQSKESSDSNTEPKGVTQQVEKSCERNNDNSNSLNIDSSPTDVLNSEAVKSNMLVSQTGDESHDCSNGKHTNEIVSMNNAGIGTDINGGQRATESSTISSSNNLNVNSSDLSSISAIVSQFSPSDILPCNILNSPTPESESHTQVGDNDTVDKECSGSASSDIGNMSKSLPSEKDPTCQTSSNTQTGQSTNLDALLQEVQAFGAPGDVAAEEIDASHGVEDILDTISRYESISQATSKSRSVQREGSNVLEIAPIVVTPTGEASSDIRNLNVMPPFQLPFGEQAFRRDSSWLDSYIPPAPSGFGQPIVITPSTPMELPSINPPGYTQSNTNSNQVSVVSSEAKYPGNQSDVAVEDDCLITFAKVKPPSSSKEPKTDNRNNSISSNIPSLQSASPNANSHLSNIMEMMQRQQMERNNWMNIPYDNALQQLMTPPEGLLQDGSTFIQSTMGQIHPKFYAGVPMTDVQQGINQGAMQWNNPRMPPLVRRPSHPSQIFRHPGQLPPLHDPTNIHSRSLPIGSPRGLLGDNSQSTVDPPKPDLKYTVPHLHHDHHSQEYYYGQRSPLTSEPHLMHPFGMPKIPPTVYPNSWPLQQHPLAPHQSMMSIADERKLSHMHPEGTAWNNSLHTKIGPTNSPTQPGMNKGNISPQHSFAGHQDTVSLRWRETYMNNLQPSLPGPSFTSPRTAPRALRPQSNFSMVENPRMQYMSPRMNVPRPAIPQNNFPRVQNPCYGIRGHGSQGLRNSSPPDNRFHVSNVRSPCSDNSSLLRGSAPSQSPNNQPQGRPLHRAPYLAAQNQTLKDVRLQTGQPCRTEYLPSTRQGHSGNQFQSSSLGSMPGAETVRPSTQSQSSNQNSGSQMNQRVYHTSTLSVSQITSRLGQPPSQNVQAEVYNMEIFTDPSSTTNKNKSRPAAGRNEDVLYVGYEAHKKLPWHILVEIGRQDSAAKKNVGVGILGGCLACVCAPKMQGKELGSPHSWVVHLRTTAEIKKYLIPVIKKVVQYVRTAGFWTETEKFLEEGNLTAQWKGLCEPPFFINIAFTKCPNLKRTNCQEQQLKSPIKDSPHMAPNSAQMEAKKAFRQAYNEQATSKQTHLGGNQSKLQHTEWSGASQSSDGAARRSVGFKHTEHRENSIGRQQQTQGQLPGNMFHDLLKEMIQVNKKGEASDSQKNEILGKLSVYLQGVNKPDKKRDETTSQEICKKGSPCKTSQGVQKKVCQQSKGMVPRKPPTSTVICPTFPQIQQRSIQSAQSVKQPSVLSPVDLPPKGPQQRIIYPPERVKSRQEMGITSIKQEDQLPHGVLGSVIQSAPKPIKTEENVQENLRAQVPHQDSMIDTLMTYIKNLAATTEDERNKASNFTRIGNLLSDMREMDSSLPVRKFGMGLSPRSMMLWNELRERQPVICIENLNKTEIKRIQIQLKKAAQQRKLKKKKRKKKLVKVIDSDDERCFETNWTSNSESEGEFAPRSRKRKTMKKAKLHLANIAFQLLSDSDEEKTSKRRKRSKASNSDCEYDPTTDTADDTLSNSGQSTISGDCENDKFDDGNYNSDTDAYDSNGDNHEHVKKHADDHKGAKVKEVVKVKSRKRIKMMTESDSDEDANMKISKTGYVKEKQEATLQEKHEATEDDASADVEEPIKMAEEEEHKTVQQVKSDIASSDAPPCTVGNDESKPSQVKVSKPDLVSNHVSMDEVTSDELWETLRDRPSMYFCDCGMIFQQQPLYYLHRSSHTTDNLLKCNLCQQTLDSNTMFLTHFFEGHVKKS